MSERPFFAPKTAFRTAHLIDAIFPMVTVFMVLMATVKLLMAAVMLLMGSLAMVMFLMCPLTPTPANSQATNASYASTDYPANSPSTKAE